MRIFTKSPLIASLVVPFVWSITFDLEAVPRAPRRDLARRNALNLDNFYDLYYRANITLNGKPVAMLVDTGSSDFVAVGEVEDSDGTGHNATVPLVMGELKGEIRTAELDIGGYVVKSQAYLQAEETSFFSEGEGVLGLGTSKLSRIFAELPSSEGYTFLDHYFADNSEDKHFFTLLLGRKQDPTDRYSGALTIGETAKEFQDVTKQPKLPILPPTEGRGQHYYVLLDEAGIFDPNGNPITIKTKVAGAKNPHQARAIIDSGMSNNRVPKEIADAIYSKIDGAVFNASQNSWQFACTQEINMTISLGGQKYPIHPLDQSGDRRFYGETDPPRTAKGEPACWGTFQPIDYVDEDPYDIILGMPFLRNVYMLIHMGKLAEVTTSTVDPSMQLLSTTDPAEAHLDFLKVYNLTQTTTSGTSTPTRTGSPSSTSSAAVRGISPRTRTIAIGVGAALGALLILVTVGVLFSRRKQKKHYVGRAYAPITHPAPGY